MKKSLPFVIIILVLVVALGGCLMLWKRSSSAGTNANSTFATSLPNSPASTSNSTPDSSSGNASGSPKPNVKVSSPVVLEEYGDYQCPPCGQLYPDLKQIEKEYGSQVQIVFHHFPLMKIHKNALAAAHAAEAARNQNKFWEMHDLLYRNQKEWSELDDPRPVFIDYAKQLGLKIEQFTNDLGSNVIDQRISADMQRGSAMGVTGTPPAFLDSRLINYRSEERRVGKSVDLGGRRIIKKKQDM